MPTSASIPPTERNVAFMFKRLREYGMRNVALPGPGTRNLPRVSDHLARNPDLSRVAYRPWRSIHASRKDGHRNAYRSPADRRAVSQRDRRLGDQPIAGTDRVGLIGAGRRGRARGDP